MKSLALPVLSAVLAIAPLDGVAQQAPASRLDTRIPSAVPRVLTVDRIIAVVNDQVITQNDLNERITLVKRQLQGQNVQLPPPDVISKQLLERMINDLVQVQLAKENGIKVDDATLEKTIQRIAEDNNLSMAAFRAMLEKDGIKYPRFREDIRQEILLTRLREREVDNTIVVTDAEVESQLAAEARDQTSNVEFRLSHILVTVPQQATPDQIEARRRRALQALSELRKGAVFAQVAATYSDATDALQGGNLGWRAAGRLPTLFLDTVDKLKPGETSDIVRSPNGFHIIKLLEKRGKTATSDAVQQTHARHILVRTKDTLSDADVRARLVSLRERIVAGEDFAEIAKVASDDSSAAKGGDLGWLVPGDTVPEFERAMNALRDGEVSQPVQSQFGWHLIQVTERRAEPVSEDRKKAAARNAVRARKGDEAYQDWLRQIRDRAFVEYRLEDR
jgi:peptidyl-prolyl cis-trans isomerase SurA